MKKGASVNAKQHNSLVAAEPLGSPCARVLALCVWSACGFFGPAGHLSRICSSASRTSDGGARIVCRRSRAVGHFAPRDAAKWHGTTGYHSLILDRGTLRHHMCFSSRYRHFSRAATHRRETSTCHRASACERRTATDDADQFSCRHSPEDQPHFRQNFTHGSPNARGLDHPAAVVSCSRHCSSHNF